MIPDSLRATFVLACPPDSLRANVPNVRSDEQSFGKARRLRLHGVGGARGRTDNQKEADARWHELLAVGQKILMAGMGGKLTLN